MQPRSQRLPQDRNGRLRLFVLCAILSSAGSTIVSCSSHKPHNLDASQADPNNSQAANGSGGHAGKPSSSGTGGASSSGISGGQAMGPMAGMKPSGDGGQALGPDATVDGGPIADCTPVEWVNPGAVANPVLEAVPADAGKLGMPFEQTAGMDEYDYVMEEFFFSGTSPAYTTRMVVRRPRDPAKFSGTVFVEWYNVSGGIDFAVMWANSREYFMREGHVFIGVSAQQVGADGLKDTDPERYAKIQHPGDDYAATIFSQAGVAIHSQSEKLLGPCMPVHAVLAVGQSQSAFQLAQYVDNTHPTDKVYDGYLIHSGSEPKSNDPGVPTFVVFTMSEGNGALKDGPNMVKWMMAKTTHNDKQVTTRNAELGTAIGVGATQCVNPMNEFPSYRAYNTVLEGLNRWVRKGERPPAGMPFEMSSGQLALDEHKNVLGGVRIPDIDVPIATYGLDNGPVDPLDIIGTLACGLGGETIPFMEAELLKLYPTHDEYIAKYTDAADKALAGGYLLQADHDESIEQAKAAPIPK